MIECMHTACSHRTPALKRSHEVAWSQVAVSRTKAIAYDVVADLLYPQCMSDSKVGHLLAWL